MQIRKIATSFRVYLVRAAAQIASCLLSIPAVGFESSNSKLEMHTKSDSMHVVYTRYDLGRMKPDNEKTGSWTNHALFERILENV